MKYKISMIIVMLLLFRIPVFMIYDGDDLVYVKFVSKKIPIESTQLHSVSLTDIEDLYYVTPYYIYQYAVVYSDQGGAGMPNQNNVLLKGNFNSKINQKNKQIFLLLDDNNQLIVSNESIDYQNTKTHYMQMKISRLFLLEYLYKVGSL